MKTRKQMWLAGQRLCITVQCTSKNIQADNWQVNLINIVVRHT